VVTDLVQSEKLMLDDPSHSWDPPAPSSSAPMP
jgi:hypothetical protein